MARQATVQVSLNITALRCPFCRRKPTENSVTYIAYGFGVCAEHLDDAWAAQGHSGLQAPEQD